MDASGLYIEIIFRIVFFMFFPLHLSIVTSKHRFETVEILL